MAVKVARWRDDYGIDGIDLDLEEGAGGRKVSKELKKKIIKWRIYFAMWLEWVQQSTFYFYLSYLLLGVTTKQSCYRLPDQTWFILSENWSQFTKTCWSHNQHTDIHRLALYCEHPTIICLLQVQAEIDVINASWNPGGTSNGLADSIGLMVYEKTQALIYLKNYAGASSQWQVNQSIDIKLQRGSEIFWYKISSTGEHVPLRPN